MNDNSISPNDVLLGRGGNTFRHIGNRKFRDLARSLARKYANSTKLAKSQIARDMVNSLKDVDPPGRFLKKVGFRQWEEVPDVIAREKASQCLRDAVSELVNTNTESPNEDDATNAKAKSDHLYLEVASSDRRQKSSCSAASAMAKSVYSANLTKMTDYNNTFCSSPFPLQRGHQMSQQISCQNHNMNQSRTGLFNHDIEPSFTMRQSSTHGCSSGIF